MRQANQVDRTTNTGLQWCRMTAAESRTPHPSPIHQAAHVRREIAGALRDGTWYSQPVSSNVVACLLGIDKELLANHHMSILFQNTPQGPVISAGTNRQTAMEAFRTWKTSDDPPSRNTFARDAYMTLYRMFQAAAQSAGDVVFAEVAEFFVTALAESDPTWTPFLERIQGFGDIPGDADMRIVGEKMDELWSQIPPGMRSQLGSFNPRNLFGS